MRFNIKAAAPDEIEFTVSITMTLAEWKMIHRDLQNGSIQSSVFKSHLVNIIEQGSASFDSEVPT